MWPTVTTHSLDLIWIAQQYGSIYFEVSFNSIATVNFPFSISPSSCLVHMITVKKQLWLEKKNHCINCLQKDWSWSKTDFCVLIKKIEKRFTCKVCNWGNNLYFPGTVQEIGSRIFLFFFSRQEKLHEQCHLFLKICMVNKKLVGPRFCRNRTSTISVYSSANVKSRDEWSIFLCHLSENECSEQVSENFRKGKIFRR